MFQIPYGDQSLAVLSVENNVVTYVYDHDRETIKTDSLSEFCYKINTPFLPTHRVIEETKQENLGRYTLLAGSNFKGVEGSWMKCCYLDWWFFVYYNEFEM